MARLNIEDDFFLEIGAVVAKMGDQDVAIGNAVRFLRFAQERHKKGKLITEAEFKEHGFSENLIPYFAKRTPSGIQAVGANKHFAWLQQKKDAGAIGGKKSAKRNRDEKGKLLKKSAETGENAQANSKHSQASYSYSSSYSESTSDSFKKPTVSAKKTQFFIAAYCERFKQRWGVNPEIFDSRAGIAKRIAKNLSEEKIILYLDTYFEMPDAWLVKNKHPIEAFEKKIGEIVVFLKSGTFTSQREANQADASIGLASQIDLIRSGGI